MVAEPGRQGLSLGHGVKDQCNSHKIFFPLCRSLNSSRVGRNKRSSRDYVGKNPKFCPTFCLCEGSSANRDVLGTQIIEKFKEKVGTISGVAALSSA